MRLIALLATASFVAPAVVGQPSLGQPAPDPEIESYLQGPSTPLWTGLKDLALILDFWATWCAPCVTEIPHMNALADSFSTENVRFISIAEEPANIVYRFLEDRPMRGWIALDADGSAREAYGVSTLPTTALIYPNGSFAGWTHPSHLNSAVIRALINKEPLPLDLNDAPGSGVDSLRALILAGQNEPALTETFFDVRVHDEILRSGATSTISPRQRRIEVTGTPLRHLLSFLLAGPINQNAPRGQMQSPMRFMRLIDDPDSLLAGSVSIDVSVPQVSEDEFYQYVTPRILDALGLELREEEQPTDVLVLRQIPGIPHQLKAASGERSRTSSANGILTARSATPEQMARSLSTSLELPVFDETGLTGSYDYLIEVDESIDFYDPTREEVEAVRAAVREQLGLELVWDLRPVTKYVVTRTDGGS